MAMASFQPRRFSAGSAILATITAALWGASRLERGIPIVFGESTRSLQNPMIPHKPGESTEAYGIYQTTSNSRLQHTVPKWPACGPWHCCKTQPSPGPPGFDPVAHMRRPGPHDTSDTGWQHRAPSFFSNGILSCPLFASHALMRASGMVTLVPLLRWDGLVCGLLMLVQQVGAEVGEVAEGALTTPRGDPPQSSESRDSCYMGVPFPSQAEGSLTTPWGGLPHASMSCTSCPMGVPFPLQAKGALPMPHGGQANESRDLSHMGVPFPLQAKGALPMPHGGQANESRDSSHTGVPLPSQTNQNGALPTPRGGLPRANVSCNSSHMGVLLTRVHALSARELLFSAGHLGMSAALTSRALTLFTRVVAGQDGLSPACVYARHTQLASVVLSYFFLVTHAMAVLSGLVYHPPSFAFIATANSMLLLMCHEDSGLLSAMRLIGTAVFMILVGQASQASEPEQCQVGIPSTSAVLPFYIPLTVGMVALSHLLPSHKVAASPPRDTPLNPFNQGTTTTAQLAGCSPHVWAHHRPSCLSAPLGTNPGARYHSLHVESHRGSSTHLPRVGSNLGAHQQSSGHSAPLGTNPGARYHSLHVESHRGSSTHLPRVGSNLGAHQQSSGHSAPLGTNPGARYHSLHVESHRGSSTHLPRVGSNLGAHQQSSGHSAPLGTNPGARYHSLHVESHRGSSTHLPRVGSNLGAHQQSSGHSAPLGTNLGASNHLPHVGAPQGPRNHSSHVYSRRGSNDHSSHTGSRRGPSNHLPHVGTPQGPRNHLSHTGSRRGSKDHSSHTGSRRGSSSHLSQVRSLMGASSLLAPLGTNPGARCHPPHVGSCRGSSDLSSQVGSLLGPSSCSSHVASYSSCGQLHPMWPVTSHVASCSSHVASCSSKTAEVRAKRPGSVPLCSSNSSERAHIMGAMFSKLYTQHMHPHDRASVGMYDRASESAGNCTQLGHPYSTKGDRPNTKEDRLNSLPLPRRVSSSASTTSCSKRTRLQSLRTSEESSECLFVANVGMVGDSLASQDTSQQNNNDSNCYRIGTLVRQHTSQQSNNESKYYRIGSLVPQHTSQQEYLTVTKITDEEDNSSSQQPQATRRVSLLLSKITGMSQFQRASDPVHLDSGTAQSPRAMTDKLRN
eukprot:gene22186-29248_t